MKQSAVLTRDFKDIRRSDGAVVGGKNASLGELVNALAPQGVAIPSGFAVTAQAYWEFVRANGIRENIARLLAGWQAGRATLPETGDAIRKRFLWGGWPPDVEEAIKAAHRRLVASERKDTRDGRDGDGNGDVDADVDVAVRSSATAEDLPDASFAGQLDSFLNVRGEEALPPDQGFDQVSIGLSVGVQRMVRSDIGGAGVLFSLDPDSGFDQVVLINAAWGLGENVVQGTVTPDEYHVSKPLLLADPGLTPIINQRCGEKAMKMIYTQARQGRQGEEGRGGGCTRNVPTSKAEREAMVLSPREILQLARWGCLIEQHYGRPMDMEWARDGLTGQLFIVQARPETVHSRRRDVDVFQRHQLVGARGCELVRGLSVMLNMANPAAAYRWWRLPASGIGLARMEFVVSNSIQVHPMALVHFDELRDQAAKDQIARLTAGYRDKPAYFVDRLAHGFAALCAAVYPRPAILRLSDFKTNEYANLIGGSQFEPREENPMLGLRGASRYYSPRYSEAFALECRAIKQLRETIGFTNAIVMIPFCRTIDEARRVLALMAENGLVRGQDGLQVYMMCEIPSNVILAAEFAEHFDGFSIGSNDLTQLTLGVDRDAEELAHLFSEQDQAVRWMIAEVIAVCRKKGCKIGLCGQAPSDHPEFARFLVQAGIDSISVSPDSFVAVAKNVQAALASSGSPA
ncbi:Pyruvate/Phosphoenolpyruvate kinase-like domain-containing protein [Aspergillus spinulosporus]